MEKTARLHIDNLDNADATVRYASFQYLLELTSKPVDWAYEVWDKLLLLTKAGDNHQRTIAVQLLSNLAKSDPDQKMLTDLAKLMLVTKDEKFVTARHSLQCLWKVGIVNDALKAKLLTALSKRFKESAAEKNCTLIRHDILEVIRQVFDRMQDQPSAQTAADLIALEKDEKYRKKYLGIWKDVFKAK